MRPLGGLTLEQQWTQGGAGFQAAGPPFEQGIKDAISDTTSIVSTFIRVAIPGSNEVMFVHPRM